MFIRDILSAGFNKYEQLFTIPGWFKTPEIAIREATAARNGKSDINSLNIGVAHWEKRQAIVKQACQAKWKNPVHVVGFLLYYRYYNSEQAAEADLPNATRTYNEFVNKYIKGNVAWAIEITQSDTNGYWNSHIHLLLEKTEYHYLMHNTKEWRRGRNPAERGFDMRIAQRRRKYQSDNSYVFELMKYITKHSKLIKFGHRKYSIGGYPTFNSDRFFVRIVDFAEKPIDTALTVQIQQKIDQLKHYLHRINILKQQKNIKSALQIRFRKLLEKYQELIQKMGRSRKALQAGNASRYVPIEFTTMLEKLLSG